MQTFFSSTTDYNVFAAEIMDKEDEQQGKRS